MTATTTRQLTTQATGGPLGAQGQLAASARILPDTVKHPSKRCSPQASLAVAVTQFQFTNS